jgi:hypothetical protein
MSKFASMFRLGISTLTLATLAVWAHPGTFAFTIGNPVASQDFHFKTAAFVFRTESCADPAKAQISATAKGMVKGARQSVALKVMSASKPGVYAVTQSWPAEGDWVVSLRGTCGSASAGAIVPMGPKGFIRESLEFYARPATDAEIEASLKALGASK